MKFDLLDKHLYLCTPLRDDICEFVEQCIRGGVDIVQLRDKTNSDDNLLRGAKLLSDLCHSLNTPFIVNDRVDIALLSLADGIHVGQNDITPKDIQLLLKEDMIVGLSTHSNFEIEAIDPDVIDYFSIGPVEKTPTKPGREPVSLDALTFAETFSQSLTRTKKLPFFVTGGVAPEKVQNLYNHGASRFVVVRYLTESKDPYASAKELKLVINKLFSK